MKRVIGLILALIIMVFGFNACVDIDEALPHYRVPDNAADDNLKPMK